ncbi:unnamed protein product, partial [Hapterophycus canaliculatus]
SEADIAAAQAAGPSAGGAAPAATSAEAVDAPAGGGSAVKPDVPFKEIGMPALSSTMTEGKVVAWLKAEGDKVEMGEAVLVVESDKADMDVESYDEGYLAAIITGAPTPIRKRKPTDGLPRPTPPSYKISGHLTPRPSSDRRAKTSHPFPTLTGGSSTPASSDGRVIASGLAKKNAGAKGIDLSALAGTGPGGRVVARDVEAGPKGGAAGAPAPAKPSWTPGPGVVAATPT